MRALEKSAEVVVAKKPGNAGGAKDRRSRTGPMVDSSAGSQLPPKAGRGEASSDPAWKAHGWSPASRKGGDQVSAAAETGKKGPGTRLERASGDSNRRILKTVRPVVWEGAGAQSPAPDPIMPSLCEGRLPHSTMVPTTTSSVTLWGLMTSPPQRYSFFPTRLNSAASR